MWWHTMENENASNRGKVIKIHHQNEMHMEIIVFYHVQANVPCRDWFPWEPTEGTERAVVFKSDAYTPQDNIHCVWNACNGLKIIWPTDN